MSRAHACFLINISELLRKAETIAAKKRSGGYLFIQSMLSPEHRPQSFKEEDHVGSGQSTVNMDMWVVKECFHVQCVKEYISKGSILS